MVRVDPCSPTVHSIPNRHVQLVIHLELVCPLQAFVQGIREGREFQKKREDMKTKRVCIGGRVKVVLYHFSSLKLNFAPVVKVKHVCVKAAKIRFRPRLR